MKKKRQQNCLLAVSTVEDVSNMCVCVLIPKLFRLFLTCDSIFFLAAFVFSSLPIMEIHCVYSHFKKLGTLTC